MSEFKMPIEYINNKYLIDDSIVDDLELINPKDTSTSLLKYVFWDINSNTFSDNDVQLWTKYYTTDKLFLKDSQALISNYAEHIDMDIKNMTHAKQVYFNIQNDDNFMEKYSYIDAKILRPFNNNDKVLQAISIYNLTSPVLSILFPIILLIIPFIITKIKYSNITFSNYAIILKQICSKSAFKVFTLSSDTDVSTIFYSLFSIIIYIIQLYQNTKYCIKFFGYIKVMHDNLMIFKNYLNTTIAKACNLNSQLQSLVSYKPFMDASNKNIIVLRDYLNEVSKIKPWELSMSKMCEQGYILKLYYKIYDDISLRQSLEYSFKLNTYIQNIKTLSIKYKNKQINKCKFSNETKLKQAYLPIIDKPIKNDISLSKQLLVSGPNAAGKTTLLKTIFFNILFSQQTGFGFYDKASIKLYDHFYCYLNIPDSFGRDSLFQSEARRCKDIITKIEQHVDDNHLCMFDELYSGTNPYEAICSAQSFLEYINQKPSVRFLLTTHYVDICKNLNKNNDMKNIHMNIIKNNDGKLEYTYKIKQGISQIKGALNVLKKLDYPLKIVERAESILKTF